MQGLAVDDEAARGLRCTTGPWQHPPLREYQSDALDAWHRCGRRGLIVLPTGAGKTRVAIAAIASCKMSALVLVPTRALLGQWKSELERWYEKPIGCVGDGRFSVQDVTMVTFESAYRHMERLGSRFEALVIDEAHHVAGGYRGEALEMSLAPVRLGLTATAPPASTPQQERISELIGPVVFEAHIGDLVGTYLANFYVERLAVKLDPDEWAEYMRKYLPFAEMRRAFLRTNPGATVEACMRAVAKSRHGRQAIADFQQAIGIASFPRAKRSLVASLLLRHRQDKTLVFTAFADDAYALSLDNLVPAITAEVGRSERNEILARFADGRYRTLVSARVLNEGIDVPDASVAILVAGTLGRREHIQRIGRVLRPAPNKKAIVYELVAAGTLDDWRARARGRHLAA